MKKIAYGALELVGVMLVAVGVGAFSIPVALVVLGLAFVAIGEVRG